MVPCWILVSVDSWYQWKLSNLLSLTINFLFIVLAPIFANRGVNSVDGSLFPPSQCRGREPELRSGSADALFWRRYKAHAPINWHRLGSLQISWQWMSSTWVGCNSHDCISSFLVNSFYFYYTVKFAGNNADLRSKACRTKAGCTGLLSSGAAPHVCVDGESILTSNV